MQTAVVIDAIRTPIARASSDKGYFRDVRADELSAGLMSQLLDRTGLDPALVEDVRWGCVQQQGEQGFDIARIAGLMAGLPASVPGITLNRNCASSLSAINDAAMSIMSCQEDVQIVGGVEHMDHIPMSKNYDPSPKSFRTMSEGVMQMGLTAEYLVQKYRIGRQEQDQFAYRSHHLAAQATDEGHFSDEIVPTWGRDDESKKVRLTADQGIRRDTSPEALAKLRPAFDPRQGSVTAGNSSQISVGASAMLMMSEKKANELGLTPLARVKAMGVAGVEPCEMGIGPVPATKKALARAGLDLNDIGSIEINEAFAVQVLTVLKLLGADLERVNGRGGAIALGHPLGASGCRIAVTLLHRMRAEGSQLGLATLCVGQGQGVATVFEAV